LKDLKPVNRSDELMDQLAKDIHDLPIDGFYEYPKEFIDLLGEITKAIEEREPPQAWKGLLYFGKVPSRWPKTLTIGVVLGSADSCAR
jgi:hypothetical protein